MLKPVILSHNLLHNATITADSEVTGHEAWRLKDGKLHTWWQAETTASHEIVIEPNNMIQNPGFEIDLSGWYLEEEGLGAATFTRNTTGPIDGDADAKIIATTANDTTDRVRIISDKVYRLKAGRTYNLSFVAKASAVNSQLRYGLIRWGVNGAAFTEGGDPADTYYYSDITTLGVAATELSKSINLTVVTDEDIDVSIYFRALQPRTYWLDDIHFYEYRLTPDTLIIPQGHTLYGNQIQISYADTIYSSASYTDLFIPGFNQVETNEALYWYMATLYTAAKWKFTFAPDAKLDNLLPQEIPLIYFGKQWNVDRDTYKFIDNFDPEYRERIENKITSDRGLFHYVHRADQRKFIRNIMPFEEDEYENVEKFFDDTENGKIPFALSLRPRNELYGEAGAEFPMRYYGDTYIMRLVGDRNVPFFDAGYRNWSIEAEEIIGARNV